MVRIKTHFASPLHFCAPVMLILLSAVASVEYASTKWIPMAFRPSEPVQLPCHLPGQDGLSR